MPGPTIAGSPILCRQAPGRLLGAVLLSRHQPTQLVADLEAGLALGFTAAVMRPNPVRGLTLGAPELKPLYAACVANDVPLLLHEGTTPASRPPAPRASPVTLPSMPARTR